MNQQKLMDQQELQKLKDRYLNKKVHVIINDPYHPIDSVGYVVLVDDAGQLHGTWGFLAAIPSVDEITLEENFESVVYGKMCLGCPREKFCHDECEHCDEFYEELAKYSGEDII